MSPVYAVYVPRVFDWKGYRFFFFSNEGDPSEPMHVHVRKGSSVAKFWMDPSISLASSWGFTAKELAMLEKVARDHKSDIRSRWNEYFDR